MQMLQIIIFFLITRAVINITVFQIKRFHPRLFAPIQNLTRKWSHKHTYKWLTSIFLIVIFSVISVYLNLSYATGGIVFGIVLSLNDVAWS